MIPSVYQATQKALLTQSWETYGLSYTATNYLREVCVIIYTFAPPPFIILKKKETWIIEACCKGNANTCDILATWETWRVDLDTTAAVEVEYRISIPLVSPHPYILQNRPSGMEHPATGSWIVWTLSAGSAGLEGTEHDQHRTHTHTHTHKQIYNDTSLRSFFQTLT